MSDSAVAADFLAFSVKRLTLSESDILRCVDKLSEEQLWHRGGDHENSIANLLLHLEGNLRQWILHGIDGQPEVRRRDEEFTLLPSMKAAQARARFVATLEECRQVITSLPVGRLLETIDPQPSSTWRNLPILDAIFQVVAHLQQHLGQVIVLTKQMLEADLDLSIPRKR